MSWTALLDRRSLQNGGIGARHANDCVRSWPERARWVGETRKYVVRRFIKTHLLLSEWNVIPDEVCLHLRVPSM